MLYRCHISLKICNFANKLKETIMLNLLFFILIYVSMPLCLAAQVPTCLKLPNQELLSSDRVLFVMEDSEGCIWYGTEGDGVCRDDGRQVDVFRSDAEHPDLLGSNKVGCLAEMGQHIIIGTFHGAYVLNKVNFTIRQLKEVDDKRVDDILVLRSGDVLLTANMKVYRFDSSLCLRATYQSLGKYVARIFEDRSGRIWCTQWQGGLLRLEGNEFVEVEWPLDAAPTMLADDTAGRLWVGTTGRGIVRYNPDDGHIEPQPQTQNSICIDIVHPSESRYLYVSTIDKLQVYVTGNELTSAEPCCLPPDIPETAGRMTIDHEGRVLVANREGVSFAIGPIHRWNTGRFLTVEYADSIRQALNLSTRPTALAHSKDGSLWFSTGKDVRRMAMDSEKEDIMLPDTKHVSALTFAADGTLWLGTIFGQVYQYKDDLLTTDDYAANEYGDGIIAMSTDSAGLLIIVYDRYMRLYDTVRHTLRQQSREADGFYCIELQETLPDHRWSQPARNTIVERLPHWLTSWWMWSIYILITIGVLGLATYNYMLRRQRSIFLEMMTETAMEVTDHHTNEPLPLKTEMDPLLNKAIEQVEKNLSNEQYTVEELSSDLCMSRMTFYRKIQSLTGQKPTEFIRTIRLRRAAELLREGKLTITEISYATGFSSVSYFSRCFRAMYNVPPTQFGKT